MSGDLDQHQEITAALNALADDTDPEQVATVTRQFVNDDMITAAIARGAGGGGSSSSQAFTMTAQEIKDSTLTPHTVIAAQGADTLIVPTAYAVNFTAGGTPFSDAAVELVYGDFNANTLFSAILTSSGFVGWSLGPSAEGVFTGYTEGGDPSDYLNTPLKLRANLRGAIVTSVFAGTTADYAAGDTGTVDDGSPNATYVVTSVNGSAAVTGLTITDGGDGYVVPAGGVTTWTTTTGGAQPGIGTGLEVNVSEVDASASAGDGTLSGVVYYVVADLS